MLADVPVILPQSKKLLTQPVTGESHPLSKRLYLICCRLSGNCSEREAFQKKFATSLCNRGEDPLSNNTGQVCLSGFVFVLNGLQIPYERM